ncbi:MAG: hypothetical protein M0Q12_03555 [Synergistaceae bacterium]|jgi:hypothetical protein|nr:hypothetical protein [Synergistaceae bacterium]MDY0388932.1 hypothetical protein [Methanolobus sp.]NLB48520.1 hypothetical protein [Erysipelotrichia bacterium]
MKKVLLKTVFAITIAIIFSSCAALHSGYMLNSAALSSANFSYVKQNIKGEATVTYVLGIGGFSKDALVEDAKQDMLASNTLKSNQTFTNLTVNFKTTSYLGILYRVVKCTVTADVVEFK